MPLHRGIQLRAPLAGAKFALKRCQRIAHDHISSEVTLPMFSTFSQIRRGGAAMALLAIVGVLLLLAVIFFMWAVGVNNRLVKLNQGVDAAWAQVENVYQRRLDLIPNLVNTVKGAASHELDVQVGVVRERAQATQIKIDPSNPEALKTFQENQGSLGSALSRLMAVAENYPQIKANENFLQLQQQLEGTENRISVERGKFNDVVREYNTTIQTFPASFVAAFRNFKERPYFKGEAAAAKPPAVDFSKPAAPAPGAATNMPVSTPAVPVVPAPGPAPGTPPTMPAAPQTTHTLLRPGLTIPASLA